MEMPEYLLTVEPPETPWAILTVEMHHGDVVRIKVSKEFTVCGVTTPKEQAVIELVGVHEQIVGDRDVEPPNSMHRNKFNRWYEFYCCSIPYFSDRCLSSYALPLGWANSLVLEFTKGGGLSEGDFWDPTP